MITSTHLGTVLCEELCRRYRAGDWNVPRDHYAETSLAVAAFRSADSPESDRYRFGRRLLNRYLDLSSEQRGHGEFNAFALTELVRDVQQGRYPCPVDQSTILEALQFDVTSTTSQGNNWLLLQALCRFRRHSLDGKRYSDILLSKYILALAETWTTKGGPFADKPRYPIGPSETPLTYHAKQTLVYSFLAEEVDESYFERVEYGLRTLARYALPNGECLYFGRSENTLFGYACVLAAVERYISSETNPATWVSDFRRRLLDYLEKEFDPKTLAVTPGPPEETVTLDEYIVPEVYAAFAAMLLLDSPQVSSRLKTKHHPTRSHTAQTSEPTIVSLAGQDTAVGLALNGQVKYSEGLLDPRYAGLIPLTTTHRSEPVLPGIPRAYRSEDRIPFLPTVVREDGSSMVPSTWKTRSKWTDKYFKAAGTGLFHSIGNHVTSDQEEGRPKENPLPEVNRIARATKIDHVYQWWRKRPLDAEVNCRRQVVFLYDSGVLLTQTVVNTTGISYSKILPSSVVVMPDYDTYVRIQTNASGEWCRECHTHKGQAIWRGPTEGTGSGVSWTSIIVDPTGSVKNSKAYLKDGVLETVIGSGTDKSRYRLPFY